MTPQLVIGRVRFTVSICTMRYRLEAKCSPTADMPQNLPPSLPRVPYGARIHRAPSMRHQVFSAPLLQGRPLRLNHGFQGAPNLYTSEFYGLCIISPL